VATTNVPPKTSGEMITPRLTWDKALPKQNYFNLFEHTIPIKMPLLTCNGLNHLKMSKKKMGKKSFDGFGLFTCDF
jgi:hypothetical protein